MKKLFALIIISLSQFNLHAQWDTLQTGTSTDLYSVSFADLNHGVIVGKDLTDQMGKIFYTLDGGSSWTLTEQGALSKNDVQYFGMDSAYVALDSGWVFALTGYASTHHIFAIIGKKNLYALSFPEYQLGYVGGEDGVLYRYSVANGWDTLNSGTSLDIRDIFFRDAGNGWIVGDGGYIAATSDSGNTWTPVSQPFWGFVDINGIGFNAASNNGVAVGNYGDAMFSSDAGLTWNSFSSGRIHTLNKISFANDLAGVIVGDSGMILRTEDGGLTWIRDSVPGVTEDLNGICWASPSVAYICGNDGRLLKSNMDISSSGEIISAVDPTVSVYPNPFNGELHVNYSLPENSSVRITMTDALGRILFTENSEQEAGKHHYDVSGADQFATGIYLLSITTENGTVSVPVIK